MTKSLVILSRKPGVTQKQTCFIYLIQAKPLPFTAGGSGRTGLMDAILLLESGEQWRDVQARIQSIRPNLQKRYSI